MDHTKFDELAELHDRNFNELLNYALAVYDIEQSYKLLTDLSAIGVRQAQRLAVEIATLASGRPGGPAA